MDNQERTSRNHDIAKMLGWEEEQPGSWFKKNEFVNYIVYSEHNNYPHKGLPFHRDYNFLMIAVEFIKKNIKRSSETTKTKDLELFIDEWNFGFRTFIVKIIQWTKKGWRFPDTNENRDLFIYHIVNENCENEIEAIFSVVSDIASLYKK